jgi:hypothetical protein
MSGAPIAIYWVQIPRSASFALNRIHADDGVIPPEKASGIDCTMVHIIAAPLTLAFSWTFSSSWTFSMVTDPEAVSALLHESMRGFCPRNGCIDLRDCRIDGAAYASAVIRVERIDGTADLTRDLFNAVLQQ